MERRDFLSSLAVGAGVSALGPASLAGCGAAMPPHAGQPVLSARDSDDLLRRLEGGLSRVRNEPTGALAARTPWVLRPERHEALIRTGMEALVVADVARAIPAGTTVNGELARRLREELPTLTRCAVGYQQLLETVPAAARRNVDRHFRSNPEAAMDLAGWIEERAGGLGISADSRLKLRSIAHQSGARIRRQSSSALASETSSKVGTILTRSGHDLASLRAATTGALVDGIWAQTTGAAAYSSSPDPTVAQAQEPPGDPELIVSAVLIPLGVAVFGVTAIVEVALSGSVGFATLVSATPGGSLVIVGLIFLIIGAVQNSEAG